MTTELCAYTCDACDIARRTGVTRIELCAAPFEGGTTPSAGLIRYARSLPGLRLSVMIRPRGGDFCYTDAETALMAEEIRFARACGADGVVLGVLTPDGEVDETRTAQLVREAEGMEVTFHRAFDMTRDPRQALEAVIRTGCRRVLTSGGRNTAQEGVGTLRALAARPAASKSWPEAASIRRTPACWPPQGSMPCTSAPAGNVRARCASAIRRFRWAGVPVFRNTP